MEPSQPSMVIHSSASALVFSGTGSMAPMRYGRAEENHPGGAQAAWLADAQVSRLDLLAAAVAQRGVEALHVAGRAIGPWCFVAQFGQAQAPGADLDFADFPLAKARVTAKQRGIGEVLGHETQRHQQQQDVDVETPFVPEAAQASNGVLAVATWLIG